MTSYDRGDVVLVSFVFSDQSGTKLRPAVIVSSRSYNRARQEVIVAAITSNVSHPLIGDHMVEDWKEAGLLFPSMVSGVVRTIKRTMIGRQIGTLTKRDLDAVDQELRRILSL
jgi:mRNA interferase MazF